MKRGWMARFSQTADLTPKVLLISYKMPPINDTSFIPLRLFLDHFRFRKTQNSLEAQTTLYALSSTTNWHPRNARGQKPNIIRWTGDEYNDIGNKACINSLILHLLEMSVFSVRHQIDIIDSKVRHLGRKICTRMAAKNCIILLASGRRELWYGRKSYLVTFTKFMTKKHTEKHPRRKFSNIAKRESF